MEEIVKRVIWIDKKINSVENKTFLEIFKSGVKDSKFYPVDSIKKAFDLIINKREDVKLKNGNIKKDVQIFQFRLFYVIVSGSLSNDFFNEYVKATMKYTILAATVIFCSDESKHRKNPYYIDQFLNPGKVYYEKYIDKIIDFINRDENPFLNDEILNKNKEIYIPSQEKYGNVFFNAQNISDIVIPYFFGQLINSSFINETNLEIFQKRFLLKHYPELKDLIFPSREKNISVPFYLLTKFYLHMYTYEKCSFFRNMNLDLSNNKFDLYREYIFLIYDAANKKSIKKYYGPLWRGAVLSKEEFEEIMSLLWISKNTESDSINSCLCFNKTFLSFSKSEKAARDFIFGGNDEFVPVLFHLEGITEKNFNEEEFFVSNLDMQNISEFEDEKEVLILPISCFEVKSIKDSSIYIGGDKIPIKIITLNYLYKYKKLLKEFIGNTKKNKEKIEKFLKNIVQSEYSKEITKSINFDIERVIKIILEKEFEVKNNFLNTNAIQRIKDCNNWIFKNEFKDIFESAPESLVKILIKGKEALKVKFQNGEELIMNIMPEKNGILLQSCDNFENYDIIGDEVILRNLTSDDLGNKLCKARDECIDKKGDNFCDGAIKKLEKKEKKMGLKKAKFFEFYACGLVIGDFIANYDELKNQPLIVKLKSLGSFCGSAIAPFIPSILSKFLPQAIMKKVPYLMIALSAYEFILSVKDIIVDKNITKSETALLIAKTALKILAQMGAQYLVGAVSFKILMYLNILPGAAVGIIAIGIGIGVGFLISKIKDKFFSEKDESENLILFSESLYYQYIPKIFREFCIPTLFWKGVSNKAKSFAVELVEDGYRKWLVINIKKWIRKISNDNYMDVGDTVVKYEGISKHPFKVTFILYELKKEKFSPEEWGVGDKKIQNYSENLSKYFIQVATLDVF